MLNIILPEIHVVSSSKELQTFSRTLVPLFLLEVLGHE